MKVNESRFVQLVETCSDYVVVCGLQGAVNDLPSSVHCRMW